MKRHVAVLAAAALAVAGLATMQSSASAEAPLMSWDASNLKNVVRTDISCFVDYGPWSTWRSGPLPVTGSWVYKSSGSPGLYPDYAGTVQCTIRAYTKSGKVVGYPAPVHWRFVP